MSLGHQRGKVIKQLVNLLGEEGTLGIIIIIAMIMIIIIIISMITTIVVAIKAAAIISMVAITVIVAGVLAASCGFFLLCLSKPGDLFLEGVHRIALCLAKYWPLLVHNIFCSREHEVK